MPARFRPSPAIGAAAIMVNVIFWGIAPAIIKFGLEIVPPQVFLYYRFLIALALSTPVVLLSKKLFASVKSWKQLLQLFVIGIFSTLNLGILFLGVSYTTSAASAMIAGTIPLFVIVGSAFFLKEKVTAFEIVGSLVALLGTFIIVGETPVQANALNPVLGNLLVLAYNLIWTTGIILMKKYAQTYHPFVFSYTGWFLGFAVFGIISLFTHPTYILRPLMLIDLHQALFPIVYMAVFGSIVAFTAYQIAQKHLPASEVSIFTYLETVIAIPFAVYWLHETLGSLFWLGALLIIGGVVLAEIHPKSRVHSLVHKHRR